MYISNHTLTLYLFFTLSIRANTYSRAAKHHMCTYLFIRMYVSPWGLRHHYRNYCNQVHAKTTTTTTYTNALTYTLTYLSAHICTYVCMHSDVIPLLIEDILTSNILYNNNKHILRVKNLFSLTLSIAR